MRYILRFYFRLWAGVMFFALTILPALLLGFWIGGGNFKVLFGRIDANIMAIIAGYCGLFTITGILAATTETWARVSAEPPSKPTTTNGDTQI